LSETTSFFQKAYDSMKSPSILVIRPEKLGDLVVATPVLRALRHTYPSAKISVLTDQAYGVILQDDPFIDELIPISWKCRSLGRHDSILSIAGKLRAGRFDLALILYANWSGWNMVAALSGIPKVVQLGGTWLAKILGHQMVRRHAYKRNLHYRDYYLEVASKAGAFLPPGDEGNPRLYLKEEESHSFSNRFPRTQGKKRLIIHPFGHGSSPNYSLQSYADLALRCVEELGAEVFITGGENDMLGWNAPAHPLIRNDWLGTMSLREIMAACANVDTVVCGSTGIIHLAAALGTPTVGIYCPHPGSHPKAWGPIGLKCMNLSVPEALCRKLCKSMSTCSGYNSCDLICGISQDQVISSIRDAIA
jgi:ADP-heptose:LPS heptosyltransferase